MNALSRLIRIRESEEENVTAWSRSTFMRRILDLGAASLEMADESAGMATESALAFP
jgi:hypothetical protein